MAFIILKVSFDAQKHSLIKLLSIGQIINHLELKHKKNLERNKVNLHPIRPDFCHAQVSSFIH